MQRSLIPEDKEVGSPELPASRRYGVAGNSLHDVWAFMEVRGENHCMLAKVDLEGVPCPSTHRFDDVKRNTS